MGNSDQEEGKKQEPRQLLIANSSPGTAVEGAIAGRGPIPFYSYKLIDK